MGISVTSLLVVLSYLSGAIPFGVLLCRAKGVDIRSIGSGNIGATNVARALGAKWALLVLALDAGKGWGPVMLAGWFMQRGGGRFALLGLCMVAAVLGHVFPVFCRFRGGKGVATGLGVTLAASPIAAAAGAGAYAVTYALFRISSVGSLAGLLATLLTMFLLDTPRAILGAMSAIGLLILMRHRDNLRRLWRGEER